ncbi:MAG: undecaprenyl/decaprenyl-phosphate alpha-N-acetylglucosaminyl 1-phosphate transferase, partial [Bacilli bacterium]|nr:undecaprenyl/decaprenyl-phosphate alpha-N-acetylglucosaminyl 1-phosphate transferase [Bacilli bacterium]
MGEAVITRIFLMILVSFLFVAFVMPFVKKLAFHIGALDIPRSEEGHRHIHTKTTPKLGGLAMFLGFLFTYMFFGDTSSTMNSILIGSFLIIITGIIDDIHSIRALVKFVGQLAAACVVTFYGGILLQDVSAFGIYIDFGIFAYPITIFFILGCINCINLIDGLDGLAGGISAIYFLTIGIIAAIMGSLGLDVILTFMMIGAVLGFLVHNVHPATIFAGDSGSMFMGFM